MFNRPGVSTSNKMTPAPLVASSASTPLPASSVPEAADGNAMDDCDGEPRVTVKQRIWEWSTQMNDNRADPLLADSAGPLPPAFPSELPRRTVAALKKRFTQGISEGGAFLKAAVAHRSNIIYDAEC